MVANISAAVPITLIVGVLVAVSIVSMTILAGIG